MPRNKDKPTRADKREDTTFAFDIPELLDQDISWGITEKKSDLPKQGDIFIDSQAKEFLVCFVDGIWVTIAEGSGSVLKVEFSDAQLGGSDIVTLNFGAGFDGTESPDTQINITLDHSELTFPTWSDTGITGAELEDLSDGGETSIHSHALASNDHPRSHGHNLSADDSSIIPVSINLSTFFQMSGETLITVASSPQNDFDPNGVGATMAGVLIDPSTVNVTISGMVKAGDGHVVFITNRTGTNDIILEDEGAGSTATNRFTFSNSANITLKGDEGVWLRYDTNTGRWKCIGEHRPQAFGTAANEHAAETTATESAEGIVELATAAEATTGTADRVLALANLAALLQAGSYIYKADTASDDTYLLALTPTLTAYTKGMVISFEAQTANTGAATLNIDTLGAKPIKKQHDVALASNDIEANQIVTVVYDGTNFQMQSQVATAPTAGAHASTHGVGQSDDLISEQIGAASFIVSAATTAGIKLRVVAGLLQVREGDDSTGAPLSADTVSAISGLTTSKFTLTKQSIGIVSDEIATAPTHANVYVTSESGATDDLKGIAAGSSDQLIFITPTADDNITLKHNAAGSQKPLLINGEADVILSENHHFAIGIFNTTADAWDVMAIQVASTTLKGIVELATAAEVTAATVGDKVVTAEALGDSDYGERIIGILISDPAGDALTTGTAKATVRIPSSMNVMDLKEANASVTTVSSSGAITIQLVRSRRSSPTARTLVDMLSTEIDIDVSEFDSLDGAAEVINTSNDDVSTGDQILIDVDAAGTGAKGLYVEMIFRVP